MNEIENIKAQILAKEKETAEFLSQAKAEIERLRAKEIEVLRISKEVHYQKLKKYLTTVSSHEYASETHRTIFIPIIPQNGESLAIVSVGWKKGSKELVISFRNFKMSNFYPGCVKIEKRRLFPQGHRFKTINHRSSKECQFLSKFFSKHYKISPDPSSLHKEFQQAQNEIFTNLIKEILSERLLKEEKIFKAANKFGI